MEINKEKLWYFLQFFSDKDENARQTVEIVYGTDTEQLITRNFGFHSGMPVVKNIDIITVMIEVGRHVRSPGTKD
ncbi:hypothetical protein TNCT_281121 [Trichonephila clavata]|uniref:Uncharacterized protein n=1 Tax=Trichonephila clavata TaxID=2740835 RepID=A0A8X6HPA2_TRICU|nr:hypothetical protein TNCT_281121 [Trichonephila clavata]